MTILVATDLTGRSDRALHRAALVANAADEPLVVLHVIEEQWSSAELARKKTEAQEALAAMVDALPRRPREVVPVAAEGSAPEIVLRHAAQHEARLIVLGTRHQPSATERFLGTTIDNVVRGARLPILLVRNSAGRSYARAVAGIDFSPHGVCAAKSAMQMFPDCAFTLVHAYDVPFAGFQQGARPREQAEQDHRQRLQALVSEEMAPPQPSTVDLAVRRGEVLEVLCHEVRERRADLLVTGTHGRTGLAHAILGSVAETLLSNPPCDVMVARRVS